MWAEIKLMPPVFELQRLGLQLKIFVTRETILFQTQTKLYHNGVEETVGQWLTLIWLPAL